LQQECSRVIRIYFRVNRAAPYNGRTMGPPTLKELTIVNKHWFTQFLNDNLIRCDLLKNPNFFPYLPRMVVFDHFKKSAQALANRQFDLAYCSSGFVTACEDCSLWIVRSNPAMVYVYLTKSLIQLFRVLKFRKSNWVVYFFCLKNAQ
jgi:hypothetical protein